MFYSSLDLLKYKYFITRLKNTEPFLMMSK